MVNKVSPKSGVKTILIACDNRRTAAESRPYLAQQAGTGHRRHRQECPCSSLRLPRKLPTTDFFPTGTACRVLQRRFAACHGVVNGRSREKPALPCSAGGHRQECPCYSLRFAGTLTLHYVKMRRTLRKNIDLKAEDRYHIALIVDINLSFQEML